MTHDHLFTNLKIGQVGFIHAQNVVKSIEIGLVHLACIVVHRYTMLATGLCASMIRCLAHL